jgi:hypothetical protein
MNIGAFVFWPIEFMGRQFLNSKKSWVSCDRLFCEAGKQIDAGNDKKGHSLKQLGSNKFPETVLLRRHIFWHAMCIVKMFLQSTEGSLFIKETLPGRRYY